MIPLLKKAGMDVANMANYHPVSNLSFISKTIECIVVEQLNRYLTANCLLPRFQSAYRRFHSTENALLHVMLDILKVADQQQVTLLGLLDLSAAFDCVDREIL